MIQLPGSGKEACQIMMQVLQQVPCYYLELGTDLEQIPQVIFDLITKQ